MKLTNPALPTNYNADVVKLQDSEYNSHTGYSNISADAINDISSIPVATTPVADNALVVSASGNFAYVDRVRIAIEIEQTNTLANVTINIDGVGVVPLKNVLTGLDFAAGELPVGVFDIFYKQSDAAFMFAPKGGGASIKSIQTVVLDGASYDGTPYTISEVDSDYAVSELKGRMDSVGQYAYDKNRSKVINDTQIDVFSGILRFLSNTDAVITVTEFDKDAVKSIQKIETTFDPGGGATDITIASVDPLKTLMYFDYESTDGISVDYPTDALRKLYIVDATTARIDGLRSSLTNVTIGLKIVELK